MSVGVCMCVCVVCLRCGPPTAALLQAYYTIAHLLQGGVLDGSKPGPLGITVDQMTDEVFDAIYLSGSDLTKIPTGLPVDADKIRQMKKEFEYW
jgi:leucyl-tRNA synthetase